MHTPSQAEDRQDAPPHVGWLARIVVTCLSLALGLVMVEGLAAVARDHAFPFLNIYEPDPTFGVRLTPSTSTATRSREGRVTDVYTNALGFRGPEWTPAEVAAPVAGRVMLLGDSQVFGYGVDEADSVAARLQEELGIGSRPSSLTLSARPRGTAGLPLCFKVSPRSSTSPGAHG